MLKDALEYASMGLSVIPIHGIVDGQCTCGQETCKKPGKHPRLKWKSNSEKCASTETIKVWWAKYPESNVGIVTGEISGIAVLDIDGDEGLQSLKDAGYDLKDFPVTPTSKTGGGGYHLIFKMTSSAKTKSGVLKNVDVRAKGGMIVAPPSLHASGNSYLWVPDRSISDVAIAEFDFESLHKGKGPPKDKKSSNGGQKWFETCLTGVQEGLRNDSATRLAGRYFSLGFTWTEAKFMLTSWNTLNNPPLPGDEISTIVTSIENKENLEDGQSVDDSLDIISSIIRMRLDSVKRISGDEPQYLLEFDEGKCIVTIAQILSPKLFQQAVAEATNVLIRKLSVKTIPTHTRLVQLIMSCAEEMDAGIEATSTGEIIALLRDYAQHSTALADIDKGDDVPVSGAFIADSTYWVPLEDLVQRGGQKWGMRIPIKSMAQRLRAMGISRRSFMLNDGSSKSMWNINLDNLDRLRGDNHDE